MTAKLLISLTVALIYMAIAQDGEKKDFVIVHMKLDLHDKIQDIGVLL